MKSQNEQRNYPRIECRIGLTADNGLVGTIENIGLEGLYIYPNRVMTVGEERDIEFSLTENSEPVRGTIRTVRVDGGKSGYGVKFLKMSPKDKGLLKHFLFARISDKVQACIHQQYQEKSDQVIRISDRERVRLLLEDVMGKRALLTVIPEKSHVSHKASIINVGVENFGIRLDSLDGRLEKGIKIFVFLSHQFESYTFQTEILDQQHDILLVEMPNTVFCSDRRTHPRQEAGSRKWVRMEWHTHQNTIEKCVGVVMEESTSGLSFVAPVEWINGSSFDSALKELEIITPDQPVKKEHVVVKHLNRIDSAGRLSKVGVEFKVSQENFQFDVEDFSKYLQARETPSNQAVVGLPPVSQVLRYTNVFGEEIVALVNRTWEDDRKISAPVVIIPPAYGRRKESTCGLALTITENFKQKGKDIVVVRFDYTRAIGESFNDVEEPIEGREYLNIRYSRYVEDIRATIRFSKDNPIFSATQIILVSFSFNGPVARRVVAQDREGDITLWLSPLGAPDTQELVKNSGGGIDYLGNYEKGIRSGIVNFLGSLVNMDQFCEDAIRHQLAFMEDARREMATIKIPVTWIYGTHDGWINPRKILDLMRVKSPAPRRVIQIPTGHMLSTSEEALHAFQLITECIWQHLHHKEIQAVSPSPEWMMKANRLEWDRTARTHLMDRQAYWKKYLLGDRIGEFGFDVLMNTAEYRELISDQLALLHLSERSIIADMGSGTGNLVQAILKENSRAGGQKPKDLSIIAVDLVYDALVRSMEKCRAQLREDSQASIPPVAVVADLEIGRIDPFKRLANWSSTDRIEEVLSGIEGVDLFTIERIASNFDSRLLSILRGDLPIEENSDFLQERFMSREIEVISELHALSRLLIKRDRTAGRKFKILRPLSPINDFSLPFKHEVFDGILSSLVLSYIFNQQALLLEFHRCLKPGGRLVVSSMLPDTDISKVYMGLIDNIMDARELDQLERETLLSSARDFASAASFLIRLEEEGRFKFFSAEALAESLRKSGFKKIRITPSFGKPARAVIVSGEKWES